MFPTCCPEQVKSSFDRISTISISPDRGQAPNRLPVGINQIAISKETKYNQQLGNKYKLSGIITGPNPITAGHFGANFNCAEGKTERIDGSHSSRLDWIDDVDVRFSDVVLFSNKKILD